MAEKRTMTLNRSDAEMRTLEELAAQKQLSKTALIRQALPIEQIIDCRLSAEEKLFLEDKKARKKAEVVVV
jgi:hypothetical protein